VKSSASLARDELELWISKICSLQADVHACTRSEPCSR
jgi:hypothetical protein